MTRYIYYLLTFGFILLWSSCREDFEFSPSSGNLEFSVDTLFLDTLFTNISSSTFNVKVYNRSNDDIVIPNVGLALGEASDYRLNVDGIPGKIFNNIEIQAQDSIFIFVETTVDFSDLNTNTTDFVYTDQIEFDSNENQQTVELVTLVKDAKFILPNRDNTTRVVETLTLNIDGEPVETDMEGRELLPNELTFTNEKPYVIYGYAVVPEGETLNIEAGARIHFHENSGIIVSNNASIKVNGAFSNDQDTLENEIIFEGDRLETSFTNTPGQWGSIWLLNGSKDNVINYATIKNGTIGLLCEGDANQANKLNINNSQIYNFASFGILGRNTNIIGNNVVINNVGQSSIAGINGGSYNFTHSTLVNYWNNSSRQFPALLLNNNTITDSNSNTDLTQANFNNCIIYGNSRNEISLNDNEENAFNFKFTNCLVRLERRSNDNPNFDFNNTLLYQDNIFNDDPNFKDIELNNFIIGEESAAINKANPIFSNLIPLDILNIDRTIAPDIGAYQHVIFTEEDMNNMN